jgi:pimeloyl-ACP methyl ester carboxylesterase
VALDLRGHGGSDGRTHDAERTAEAAGPPALTIDRLAGDVSEVMDALDLDRVILVGHSMGGMVALRLVGTESGPAGGGGQGHGQGQGWGGGGGGGRGAGLVLASTAANVTRHRGVPGLSDAVGLAQPLVSSASGVAARLPGPTLPAHDVAFLLARVIFGDHSSPRQVAFTGRLTSEVPMRVSAGLLLDILRFNADDVLDAIRVPTTVVVGEKDLMTPRPQAEYLAAHIEGAELVVLGGCGHMLMLERPDELNRAIIGVAQRASA